MEIDWSQPDAYGVVSAAGIKRLPFEYQGRTLEVRAVYDQERCDWIVAVKDGDAFVAPADAYTISSEKIFDAKVQGGMFANLLPVTMQYSRDAVVSGEVKLLAKSDAPRVLRRS